MSVLAVWGIQRGRSGHRVGGAGGEEASAIVQVRREGGLAWSLGGEET